MKISFFHIITVLLIGVMSLNIAAEEISFIACPVYRDTDAGPKSGCWLATDRQSGITYDVGSGLTKPLSDRAILVEGVHLNEDTGQELCGGIVLSPVRVSVLDEPCRSHIIPAEGYPGRVFRPPGDVMRPLSVARTLPEGPFEYRRYSILFNYNSDFLNYQYSEVLLEKISLYIQASQPESVSIIGYAATDPLNVSGHQLSESLSLAKARAEKVNTALLRLKVPAKILTKDWRPAGETVVHYNGGLAQETLRRVDIIINVAKSQ